MLQQTQVKTALPYFDRWMKALPTIQSVAEAEEQTLLKLWEGLGYYSRVRNLQKAARMMVEKHGGIFPPDYEDILKLPGIGKYTAGAIASIAFNQEKPIVDGNIIRLMARLLDYRENTRKPEALNVFWEKAQDWIPKGEARAFNQAMMEFGALVCTPKSPSCGQCPLQKNCGAFRSNTVDQLPNRGQATERIDLKVAVAIIQKMNKIFIQKRVAKGLMQGLWEFPGGKVEAGESTVDALHREIKEELGITVKDVTPFLRLKHAYTKYVVDLHCFRAEYEEGEVQLTAASEHQWVELEELSRFPFPAANSKIIESLLKEKSTPALF
jgi:A/G-specific adenine glycosylase